MRADNYAARLYRRDIQDLDTASNKLAAAVDAIRRFHPAWGEIVATQIIEANQIIERIRIKGATAYARFYERQGAQEPAAGPSDEVLKLAGTYLGPPRQDEEEKP